MTISCQVAVVGGGLSGLALADHLLTAGIDAHVFEARARWGGRVLSQSLENAGRRAHVDLGPSWFWPGQPKIQSLIERFGLRAFEQHCQGNMVFEDQTGAQQRLAMAPMAGAWRLENGMASLIDGFTAMIPSNHLHIACPVKQLRLTSTKHGQQIAADTVFQADHVVLAMPPRLAAQLGFEPDVQESARQTLRAVPTWMAGHTKITVSYPTPFWRAEGLSGSAISRIGPLFEVHDASGPTDQTLGALFGFATLGRSPELAGEDLENTICQQLGRLFGKQASTPLSITVQNWANEDLTATKEDCRTSGHPNYGPLSLNLGDWAGSLSIVSTESAQHSGGLLEGALEAASDHATRLIKRFHQTKTDVW